jgi:hypothetical protein
MDVLLLTSPRTRAKNQLKDTLVFSITPLLSARNGQKSILGDSLAFYSLGETFVGQSALPSFNWLKYFHRDYKRSAFPPAFGIKIVRINRLFSVR